MVVHDKTRLIGWLSNKEPLTKRGFLFVANKEPLTKRGSEDWRVAVI